MKDIQLFNKYFFIIFNCILFLSTGKVFFFIFFILMYDILRLFCENLKSIGVKLTEIWSCKSPPLRSDFELQRTFKHVFLALSFFRVNELSSSKSTAPNLLKFYTLFLYINYYGVFLNFNLL